MEGEPSHGDLSCLHFKATPQSLNTSVLTSLGSAASLSLQLVGFPSGVSETGMWVHASAHKVGTILEA